VNLLTINAAKSNFFDRLTVITAAGQARVRVFSRFGSHVRRRAKSSIRKRKKSSKPGQAPSSHVGTLRRLIFFSYDRNRNSVVMGPTLINHPTGAPEILEYGGNTVVDDVRWVSGPKYGNRRQRIATTKRVKIAARPYMGPAFKAELPGLPAMWKDSIRK